MTRIIYAALLALTAAAPASASVVVAANTPKSFNVVFDGNVATTQVAGLSAALTINFLQASNNNRKYDFSYALTNTSGQAITASRISSFAFNTTPQILTATASGLFNNTVTDNARYPNQVGSFDMCITQGNKCPGGKGAGVKLGETGTGLFSLSFASAQSQVSFDDFFVRYQSISGTRLGDSGTGTGFSRIAAVPEPTTWAMMIAGFGVIGSTMRRRRSAAKSFA